MGFVLNEPELNTGPNNREFVSRIGDDLSLKVRLFGPEVLLGQIVPRGISFLPMAYLVAATRHSSLDVNCQVGEGEWNTFMHEFVPLVTHYYDLPAIRVSRSAIAQPYVPGSPASRNSALLFSAGVDSFYTLFKLRESASGPTYLVNINAGADTNPQEWMASFGNLDQVAASLGLPVIFIDTNFREMFPRQHITCHTIRNLSAASLLSGLISTLFYSASETYIDLNYQRSKQAGVMGLIEPLFPSAMHRQDLSTILYGLDTSRIAKTSYISGQALVQSHLDVCTSTRYQLQRKNGPLNCGRCLKCMRTQLTLDALGRLQDFRSCFPVDDFPQHKPQFIEEMRKSTGQLDQDVAELLAGRMSAET